MYKIKTLSPGEKANAQALLYETYVLEYKYSPKKNNPSEQTIITDTNGRKLLIDKFDRDAIWLGVFHHNKMIACMRLASTVNGRYDIEDYCPDFSKLDIRSDPEMFEASRAATRREYRNKGIHTLLSLAVFVFCNLEKKSVFATTPIRFLQDQYQKLGIRCIENISFKYDTTDHKPVKLYYAKFSENPRENEMDKIIKAIQSTISEKPNEARLLFCFSGYKMKYDGRRWSTETNCDKQDPPSGQLNQTTHSNTLFPSRDKTTAFADQKIGPVAITSSAAIAAATAIIAARRTNTYQPCVTRSTSNATHRSFRENFFRLARARTSIRLTAAIGAGFFLFKQISTSSESRAKPTLRPPRQ